MPGTAGRHPQNLPSNALSSQHGLYLKSTDFLQRVGILGHLSGPRLCDLAKNWMRMEMLGESKKLNIGPERYPWKKVRQLKFLVTILKQTWRVLDTASVAKPSGLGFEPNNQGWLGQYSLVICIKYPLHWRPEPSVSLVTCHMSKWVSLNFFLWKNF